MVDMIELFLGLELVIVGMGITFLVLIILSSIITIIGRSITKNDEKKNNSSEEEIKVEDISKAENDYEEVMAMIAAAYMHCFKSEVPVISLSKPNENWKVLGRREMIEGI